MKDVDTLLLALSNSLRDKYFQYSNTNKLGEFDFIDPTLEKLIGRKPTDLKEFLHNIYKR